MLHGPPVVLCWQTLVALLQVPRPYLALAQFAETGTEADPISTQSETKESPVQYAV